METFESRRAHIACTHSFIPVQNTNVLHQVGYDDLLLFQCLKWCSTGWNIISIPLCNIISLLRYGIASPNQQEIRKADIYLNVS